MANENGSGGRGEFLGGLGRPGVRESKRVGWLTELLIPFSQGLVLLEFTAIGFVVAYVIAQRFIYTYDEWIASSWALIGSMWGMMLYKLGILGSTFIDADGNVIQKPSVFDFLATETDRREAVAKSIMIIIGISIIAYVVLVILNAIVIQIAITLNEDWWTMILISQAVGYVVAFPEVRKFYRTQLRDSLRDSDSNYGIRSLELEWERERYYNPPVQALPEPETERAVVMVAASPKKVISPRERFRRSMIDFLEGVQNEVWDTIEDSWKKQKLQRSEVPLTRTRGHDIRDELIRLGHAAWVNPENHNDGWELLYPIPVIIEALERYEAGRATASPSMEITNEAESEEADVDNGE